MSCQLIGKSSNLNNRISGFFPPLWRQTERIWDVDEAGSHLGLLGKRRFTFFDILSAEQEINQSLNMRVIVNCTRGVHSRLGHFCQTEFWSNSVRIIEYYYIYGIFRMVHSLKTSSHIAINSLYSQPNQFLRITKSRG